MATDIVLRSVKAASLTHAEADQNWESLAQTVDAVTANKTVAVTDQNKILEVSISTGTITLPTVANAAGTDTDSFKITIKNINATALTIDGNGAETIEGAASVILLENESAEFSLSSGSAEWNITGFYNPSLVGITSTAIEINVLDGLTATTAELNILDGIAPTTTELNYVNGVTSAIQTQIDTKAAKGANSDITSLTGLTTDLSIAQGGTAASTASGARTSLGVDAAGTDNSTNVTISAGLNYISITGQQLLLDSIDLASDISGVLPTSRLGNLAVTTAKLADSSVTAAKIALGSVIQVFTSSGTFTATKTGIHKITIIAGGGGGGGSTNVNAGGSGGRAKSRVLIQSLTASTGYTVTIGAGGTAADGGNGNTGGSTTFDGTTVVGGVGGAVDSVSGTLGDDGENLDGFGIGGAGDNGVADGAIGSGYGSGGGGSGKGTTIRGGVGTPGLIIVEW